MALVEIELLHRLETTINLILEMSYSNSDLNVPYYDTSKVTINHVLKQVFIPQIAVDTEWQIMRT